MNAIHIFVALAFAIQCTHIAQSILHMFHDKVINTIPKKMFISIFLSHATPNEMRRKKRHAIHAPSRTELSYSVLFAYFGAAANRKTISISFNCVPVNEGGVSVRHE